MTDFLSHLVAQSQGNAQAVMPLIPPLFAQAPEFASDAAVPGPYNGAPQPVISSSLEPGSPFPDDDARIHLQGPDYRDLPADLVPLDMAHTSAPFPLLHPSITLSRVAAAEEASPSEQWSEQDEVAAAEPLTTSEAVARAAAIPAEERQTGLPARRHESESAAQARPTPGSRETPPGPGRAIGGQSQSRPSFSHEETQLPAVNPAGLRLPDEQARTVDQPSTPTVIPSSLPSPVIQSAGQEPDAASSYEQDAQRAHVRPLPPAHDDAMESPRTSRGSQAGQMEHTLHSAIDALQSAEHPLLPGMGAPTRSEQSFVSNVPGDESELEKPAVPSRSEQSFASKTPGSGGKQDQPASPTSTDQSHPLTQGEHAAQAHPAPMLVPSMQANTAPPATPAARTHTLPIIMPIETAPRNFSEAASDRVEAPVSIRASVTLGAPSVGAPLTNPPEGEYPTLNGPVNGAPTLPGASTSTRLARSSDAVSRASRPIQPIDAQAIMPDLSYSAREAALFNDARRNSTPTDSAHDNSSTTIRNPPAAGESAATFADQPLAAVQHERTHEIRSRENRQKRTSIDEREAPGPQVIAQAAHDSGQAYAQGEQVTQIIRVNIGRVVVRATPAAPVPAAAPERAPRPALSLNEYLKQREGRPQ